MAPPRSSSLPSKGRSTSSTKQPKPNASSSTEEPDAVLHRITSLSSSLPPIAPTHGDLNPLIDLITLFQNLPLEPPTNTTSTSSWYQSNRQAVHTSLHALKATFEMLINHGRLQGVLKRKGQGQGQGQGASSSSKEQATQEMASVQKVKEWLQQRWTDYLQQTAKVVQAHWDMGVRISALNALMSLLRTESIFLTSLHHSRQAQFPSSTLVHVVHAILLPQDDQGLLVPEIKDEWQKWWNVCDDIRYHFLKEAAGLLSSYASSKAASHQDVPTHLVSNMITLFESLTSMPTVPKELNEWWCSTPLALKSKGDKSNKKRKTDTGSARDDGSTGVFDSSSSSESDENAPSAQKLSARESKKLLPPLLSLSAHRRVFQDCVLALLSLPLDEAQAKRVLSILHRQVLPHMTDPKRLMDWLVDCTTHGGTMAILALNGLFTLMQKHNLEYPNFYSTLYSLLTRSLLHTRYRPRFFRLLIIFLSSTHISASLVASFVKRLSRLALSAPPSAIVTIVPLVYNLLKLHPGCMLLIHRPSTSTSFNEETELLSDPFDAEEKDPNLTRALESSLWEMQNLMHHHLASVAGLAKVFKEVMNKERYGMEDFLDHSFATMFETEATRMIRNAPALAPVPQRQPIGDSFFPNALAAERPTKVIKKVVKRSLLEDEEEEDEEEVDQGPVDVVARLWVF